MSYSVEFASGAIVDLGKIDRINQVRIAKKIKWLGENFEQITPLRDNQEIIDPMA